MRARHRANIVVVASLALVLSAGGPAATAFHGGVLAALLEETGWDARHATLIVGTSAGSSAVHVSFLNSIYLRKK